MNGVVIGKRVTFGAVIGGIVGVASYIWDTLNPETPLPAHIVVEVTTIFTGIAQIIIVNKFGITLPKN